MPFLTFVLILMTSLLGAFSYVFIKQRVTRITQTPAWLLWLVVMAPALVLLAWTIVFGRTKAMPPIVAIPLFMGSFFVYLYLIQQGRIDPQLSSTPEPAIEPAEPVRPKPVTRILNEDEEKRLRNCFSWTVYYLQNLEYRPQALICRGQLRTDAESAYTTLKHNVEEQFGDRFYLLFQEDFERKPLFILVPNPQFEVVTHRRTRQRVGIAIVLACFTLLTTTWAGYNLLTQMSSSGSSSNSNIALWQGLPYAAAIMGFFMLREGGDAWVMQRNRMPTMLPYFIPMLPLPGLQIGTIGAFAEVRTPIPNRRVLFDLGVLGSGLGLIAAVGLLGWGLAHSTVVDLPKVNSMFDFKALNPQYSLLLTLLSKWALGNELTANHAIALHPIAVAGWLGVLFTAFNWMPVGQLDGGRMVHAIYGQRTGALIGQIARFLLLVLSLMQPQLLLWAFLLFLLPVVDEPTLNDVTETDGRRELINLLVLMLVLVILIPTPRILLSLLGLA